jgi:hypothetical protein
MFHWEGTLNGEQSDSDEEVEDRIFHKKYCTKNEVSTIEIALKSIRKRFRRLTLPSLVLLTNELWRIPYDDIRKTILTVSAIEMSQTEERLSDAHLRILTAFRGLRILNSLSQAKWHNLLGRGLPNLLQISAMVDDQAERNVINLHEAAPHTHWISLEGEQPTKPGWFYIFNGLRSLTVDRVADDNLFATIGDNHPQLLKRLTLKNCSVVRGFYFLRRFHISKELSISRAPRLTVGLLTPYLQRSLTRLTLRETNAATDSLLDWLIKCSIRLNKLVVPLASKSECTGFHMDFLKVYLAADTTEDLEELNIAGHKHIDDRLWVIKMACSLSLRRVNICGTGIKTSYRMRQFGREFCGQRASLIKQLIRRHKCRTEPLLIFHDGIIEDNPDLAYELHRSGIDMFFLDEEMEH